MKLSRFTPWVFALLLLSSCDSSAPIEPQPQQQEDTYKQVILSLSLKHVMDSVLGSGFHMTDNVKDMNLVFDQVIVRNDSLTITKHDSVGASYTGLVITDQTLQLNFDQEHKTISFSVFENLKKIKYSQNSWYDHQVRLLIENATYDSTAAGIAVRLEGEQVTQFLKVFQWRTYNSWSKREPGTETRFKEIVPSPGDKLELLLTK